MSDVHPSSEAFTPEEVATDPVLRYFHYDHLPPSLQEFSKPVHDLALLMVRNLPRNAERSAGLRKLLEAKDCFVRSDL